MAFTQADVDALKAAIASGARRVRYADGSEIEYRSQAELEAALARVQGEVSPPATGSSPRTSLVSF